MERTKCTFLGATTAFSRLSQRVFLNRKLMTAAKVEVYKTICISILVYSYETWTGPYRHYIKALEAFHVRCLKSVLGIQWWYKVTYVEIRHRAADINTAEHVLLQRQLRWIGHVIRMPSNRLPRPKITLRRILSKSRIPLSDLEKLATDVDIRGKVV